MLVAPRSSSGNDRAIAAAVNALGKDRVGEVIPSCNRPRCRRGPNEGKKHLGKTLKELRADPVTATGVEEASRSRSSDSAGQHRRCSPACSVALVIAINRLEGIDWDSVKGEFENADWGWAVLARGAVSPRPHVVGAPR